MNRALLEALVPAQGTAGTAQSFVLGRAPFAGTVRDAIVLPNAAVTANATNFRTLQVINKGQAGAGSTVVASLPLDTPTTDDLAAFDEKSLPLSGTAANLAVAAGDILACVETTTGTGLAHGGYKALVEITRS
jgi:hypothetical protein